MNNFTDIILKNRLGEMNKAEREDFKRNLVLNEQLRKEYSFQEKLDNILKNSMLLDTIENDPDLIKADILAQRDIGLFMDLNKSRNSGNNNNLDIQDEVEMRKKIAKAEVEMFLSGIDVLSEVWVKNYDFNKKTIAEDAEAQKITNYIKKSLSQNLRVVTLSSLTHQLTRKIGYSVAAAVLLLSLLTVKSLTNTYIGDNIFDKYYSTLEANSYRMRGNSQEGIERLQEGIDYYVSKDYAKAEIVFEQLAGSSENRSEILLYSGLNKMQQGNYNGAIALFEDLLSKQELFVPEVQWYLGLCYVKTGDKLKALPMMESLANTEGLYKNKARVILKDLKR
ncbi:MAG: tetratricopeptide repeat protein [Mariniphaga sp.]